MENNNNNNIPNLIPLDKQHGSEFPLETLPPVLRDYVKEVSLSYQVPKDLPASLVLAVCATAIGKQYNVQINPDWSEPCNIFVGIAMPPASRKSPVFKAITAPLEIAEKHYMEDNRDKLKENKRLRGIIKKAIKVAEKKAGEAEDQSERFELLERIKKLEQDMPKNIIPFRLLANDVTAEKVTNLLSKNHGRLAIMSAEGGIFDILAGRYNNNAPNFETFLKAHAGDSIRVDRMGRESETIDSPSLVVGLTVQPEVLKSMASQKGFRGRGLIGRFLMVIPPNIVGHRQTNPSAILPNVKAEYANLLTTLTTDLQKHEDKFTKPLALQLSEEAKVLCTQFQRWCEYELRPGGKLDGINDWGGKLVGAVARFAGILHIVKYRSFSINEKIDKKTFQAALSLGHYFIGHAHVAFDIMVGNELHEKALKVIDWMQLNNKNKESARSIHQALRSTFRNMKNLWPVLNLLCNHGYLTTEKQPVQNSPGRNASPIYVLTPDICTQITQITQITHNTQNNAELVNV